MLALSPGTTFLRPPPHPAVGLYHDRIPKKEPTNVKSAKY